MLQFARWKIILVLTICVIGSAFSVPNFVSDKIAAALPDWLPHKTVSLGLDLQGGAHLLLKLDVNDVIKRRMASISDSILDAMRPQGSGEKRILHRRLIRGMTVEVSITKAADYDRAYEKIREIGGTLQFNPLTGIGGGRELEVEKQDGNKIFVTLSEGALAQIGSSTLEQSVEVIRRRIDALGTREPIIQRQGSERILVQVPGAKNTQQIKAILVQTGRMDFRLVDITTSAEAAQVNGVPRGSEILPSDDGSARQYLVRKRVMVSGERLTSALLTYDQNQPVVAFTFDSVGAKKFGKVTAANVNRPFAIVLDGKVISAPNIRQAIMGGSGIITGNFTPQSAHNLAVLLQAGALPAEMKILEERTVGPSLGADSVFAGKIASLIAFGLVMLFMILAYGLFGLAADIALVINMLIILGVLSVLQATLTLPGIAGLVLTVGMAVDANVLVFERIREEVRSGKSPFAAMDAGYQRAFGTIMDANITTFFAAAVLFALGSGPVKGFSVTLAIGIVASVFTAVTVTRLFLVLWLRRTRPDELPI